MDGPPHILEEASVIAYAVLDKGNQSTGRTRHYREGAKIDGIRALALCKYQGDGGICLFYCDETWRVLTDTSHNSLADAKSQASLEFHGVGEQWQYRTPDE